MSKVQINKYFPQNKSEYLFFCNSFSFVSDWAELLASSGMEKKSFWLQEQGQKKPKKAKGTAAGIQKRAKKGI